MEFSKIGILNGLQALKELFNILNQQKKCESNLLRDLIVHLFELLSSIELITIYTGKDME